VFNEESKLADAVFLKRCACGELLGKPSLHDLVECTCGQQWLPLLDEADKQLELKFQ